MKVRAYVCGLLIVAASPLGAGERLALQVSPAVAFAPANLIVRTTVEADAANRGMQIIAESADFYRSSTIELDGENAPRTTQWEFRSMPQGTYVVKATLLGSNGRARAFVRQEVNVIASGTGR